MERIWRRQQFIHMAIALAISQSFELGIFEATHGKYDWRCECSEPTVLHWTQSCIQKHYNRALEKSLARKVTQSSILNFVDIFRISHHFSMALSLARSPARIQIEPEERRRKCIVKKLFVSTNNVHSQQFIVDWDVVNAIGRMEFGTSLVLLFLHMNCNCNPSQGGCIQMKPAINRSIVTNRSVNLFLNGHISIGA